MILLVDIFIKFPNFYIFGIVAQRLEQDAHNVLVVGSIPTDPTKTKSIVIVKISGPTDPTKTK